MVYGVGHSSYVLITDPQNFGWGDALGFMPLAGYGIRTSAARLTFAAKARINPNIPKPEVPPSSIFGRSFQDWGRNVIRWGTGAEGAQERMRSITLQELRQAGVTEAQVQAARQFYAQTAARDTGNAAAAARVQLMDRIIALLRGE